MASEVVEAAPKGSVATLVRGNKEFQTTGSLRISFGLVIDHDNSYCAHSMLRHALALGFISL